MTTRNGTSGRILLILSALTAACAGGGTQATVTMGGPARAAAPAGLEAIREDELRRDLFALASDAMRGREAGTLDELRAAAWVAERAREAGLEPAGADDSYFQFFPLRRVRQSEHSRIAIDGRALRLGPDVAVIGLSDASVEAPIVWVDDAGEPALAGVDLSGRVAAARISPAAGADVPADVSLAAWRYANASIRTLSQRLRERGAAAVILVADARADSAFGWLAANALRGRYSIDDGGDRGPAIAPPTLLVRPALHDIVAAPGARLDARLAFDSFVFPSVNVVARAPGADAAVAHEHVLFSAHLDHDGVRHDEAGDTIWNGADDNATTAVALLAIGRAFAREPARRSALFVWHGAEEKGLFGSRWYAERPTIPRDDIVATLNGDMLGRNSPDSAALLGVIPPHRNSTDLVRMALAANQAVAGFAVDSTWDRATHREGWYFRSDHLPYARAGIPALFFTSLLHPDYHTPYDEPDRIDTAKLTRMTRWMYATGRAAADALLRPRLDEGFRLERE